MIISYAVTFYNEDSYLDSLLDLLSNKREQDEVVFLLDNRVSLEAKSKIQNSNIPNLFWYEDKFQRDFAKWKNKLASYCNGDFIFNLDADELVEKSLIERIPLILLHNLDTDLYYLCRINTVEGITPTDIKRWGWNYNPNTKTINWPDPQGRLYRNNGEIKWVGKVHEKLIGYKSYSILPDTPEYSIIHHKDILRQRLQNESYESIHE